MAKKGKKVVEALMGEKMASEVKGGKVMGHIVTAVTTLGLHTWLTERLKDRLKASPRAILDYLIDHLDDLDKLNEDGSEAKKAVNELRQRLTKAKKEGAENRTVKALCQVLELDKNIKGNYDLKYPRARRRLKELGLKSEEEFWQGIELLIDDPIKEFFTRKIGGTLVKGAEKVSEKTREAIKSVDSHFNSLESDETFVSVEQASEDWLKKQRGIRQERLAKKR